MENQEKKQVSETLEVPGNSGMFVRIYPEEVSPQGHIVRENTGIFFGGEDVEGIDENEISAPEKQIMSVLLPSSPELPYPLQLLPMWQGEPALEYIIPDEARQQVFEDLYPFVPCPELDDEKVDLHQNKSFKVRDYKVIRCNNRNMLVSPYFGQSGGMVIDWMDIKESEEGMMVEQIKDSYAVNIKKPTLKQDK